MTTDQKAKRIQALAAQNSSASAWLSANPSHYALRMSDVTFKNAWKMRNLIPVVDPHMWCRCGKEEIDSLGQHVYVCSHMPIYNKVRGGMHWDLKLTLSNTIRDVLKDKDIVQEGGEPHLKNFLPLTASKSPRITSVPQETFNHGMSKDRRADIWFKLRQNNKNLLIDVTSASPLAQNIMRRHDYRAGMAADTAVKRKINDYKKFFKVEDTQDSSLWFFAVDTNGCLSKEARDLCKTVANLSGKPNALVHIYQRIAVGLQNAIAKQVYNTIHHYISDSPTPPSNSTSDPPS
jgi:hypothetical protein